MEICIRRKQPSLLCLWTSVGISKLITRNREILSELTGATLYARNDSMRQA